MSNHQKIRGTSKGASYEGPEQLSLFYWSIYSGHLRSKPPEENTPPWRHKEKNISRKGSFGWIFTSKNKCLTLHWMDPTNPTPKQKKQPINFHLYRFYVDSPTLIPKKKNKQKLRLRLLRSESWPVFVFFWKPQISWSQPTPWRIKLPREVN